MKKLNLTSLTYLSLIFNLAYAIYNSILGFISHSWWFVTISVYYAVLSVMRFAVLRIKRKSETEIFAKKFTGFCFVFLSVCLVGTVILSAVTNRGVKHNEIVMITIALYTFTKVVLGIINLVKSKKYSSPAFKTLRNISFADALVSVFSLQRSMLVTFEGMGESDVTLFNILTGSGVCIAVLVLGVNLIGGRRTETAKSKIVNATEKMAEGVKDGYKKIEKGVVDGYKKIEHGVVEGYTKIEDKFVDRYLTRDGETVEQAKERLKNNR